MACCWTCRGTVSWLVVADHAQSVQRQGEMVARPGDSSRKALQAREQSVGWMDLKAECKVGD